MGCKLDVKEGRLTFDVRQNYAKLSVFKDHDFSHYTLPNCGCDEVVSDKFVQLINVSPNDPRIFDYDLFQGH